MGERWVVGGFAIAAEIFGDDRDKGEQYPYEAILEDADVDDLSHGVSLVSEKGH